MWMISNSRSFSWIRTNSSTTALYKWTLKQCAHQLLFQAQISRLGSLLGGNERWLSGYNQAVFSRGVENFQFSIRGGWTFLFVLFSNSLHELVQCYIVLNVRLSKYKLGIGFDFHGLTDLLWHFIIKAMDYVKLRAANFCVMWISSFITKKRTKTGVSSGLTFAGNGRPWFVFLSGRRLQRKLKV